MEKKNSITGENQDQDKSKYARKNLMLLPGENEKSKYIKVITQESYNPWQKL